jgi:WD repeat-containing protein 47
VTSICIDPSGKLLISGHEDATIMLFDICGGRTIQLFRPHGDEIRTVKLSNAAYYLLSGSYDKRYSQLFLEFIFKLHLSIVITDMRGNLAEPLDYLPVAEHQDKVIQCRWHPQDFVFLSTSADKCAVLWSLPPSTNID